MNCRIRLMMPPEGEAKAFDPDFSSGSGFRWADIEYEVNPVGSKSLYHVTRCLRNGVEIPLEEVERLNPASCVDEAIAAKVHGEYSKSMLKDDLGQIKMKFPPKGWVNPVIPADLDLGELPL